MLPVEELETPIGTLYLSAEGDVLRELSFRPIAGPREKLAITERVKAYFSGDLRALDKIAVDPQGTPHQRAVWAALREIPLGKTWSYAQLAKRVGSHPRAVGSANGANPIAVVIPCHRVIASDGTLCGYGGGLPRKRWLLDHESGSLLLGRLG